MPKKKPIIENTPALQNGKIIQYYHVEIPQNEYEEKQYECLIDTVFTPENLPQPVSETHSQMRFSVSKTEQGKYFKAKFHIHSTEVSYTNQEVMKLLDLTQLLATPTKEVICLLNSQGEIKEILNVDQIYQKWKEVFAALKRESVDEKFLENIWNMGENEFSNPISSTEKTQLYNLFFFPLFNKQFTYGTERKFNLMETSHLLNGKTLNIYLSAERLDTDHSNVTIYFKGYVLNGNELQIESKKIFGNILKPDTLYKSDLSVRYDIDAEQGSPVFIRSKLKESLVGAFSYEQTMEIKETNSRESGF